MHFEKILRLTPPSYLTMPTAGIDVSASSIKAVVLAERAHGLELDFFKEVKLPIRNLPNSETLLQRETTRVLQELAEEHHIHRANIELSGNRGYIFETTVSGNTAVERRAAIAHYIDEHEPVPSSDIAFDMVPLGPEGERTHLIGTGFAKRTVEDALAMFGNAGIQVRAIESETFALPRALLRHGETETVLIIDIGRSSTKLLVASNRLPRLATTLDIGGHALTLTVQKFFGVTEEEAKRVKMERGLVPGPDNADYIEAMLATVSQIRAEVVRRIDYWDSRKSVMVGHEKISRVILVGGNATVRGLPEYLESALKIPVELGDVFTNFAPRAHWLPPLDYMESLGFGTAIGLALREYVP